MKSPEIITVPKCRLAPLILCLVIGLANVGMANLIQNGDFENCDTILSTDTTTHSTGGWIFAHYAGVNDSTGRYLGNPGKFVRLEGNGLSTSDPTATQTVSNLTVGASYRLSWDLALRVTAGGSGTGRSFGVFLDQQSYTNALYIGERLSSAYTNCSVDFVATATTHSFIFAGELDNRSNGGVGITDVSYLLDNVDLSVLASPEWRLWIAPAGDGASVNLSWPTNLSVAVLQTSATLPASVGWSNVTNTVAVSDTNYLLTLPALSDRQFFRLSQNGL